MAVSAKRTLTILISLLMVFGLVMCFQNDQVFAAKKIHVNKAQIKLNIGETYQQKLIGATGKAIKAAKVEWKSAKQAVATIDNKGKVTAVKAGTAKMTAKYKGKTYKFTVKVIDPSAYSSSDIDKLQTYTENAAQYMHQVEDYLDALDAEDIDSSCPYLSDMQACFDDAYTWINKAKTMTESKNSMKCDSVTTDETGYTTWDEMFSDILSKCDYCRSADINTMTQTERENFDDEMWVTTGRVYLALADLYLHNAH